MIHTPDTMQSGVAEGSAGMQQLARDEGIFVGFSAAAAVWAALHLAHQIEDEGREAVIVTILRDRGDRYLTQLAQMDA